MSAVEKPLDKITQNKLKNSTESQSHSVINQRFSQQQEKVIGLPSSRLRGDSGIESPSLPLKVLLAVLLLPPREQECSALTGNPSSPAETPMESVNKRSFNTGVFKRPLPKSQELLAPPTGSCKRNSKVTFFQNYFFLQ